MADSGERTEKATAKKRRDERKKGHVLTSKDITTVVSIFVVFSVIRLLFPFIYEQISLYIQKSFNWAGALEILSRSSLTVVLKDTMILLAVTAVPFLLVSIAVTVVTTGYQTKWLFTTQALKVKFSRMNPLSGLKKIVSLKSLVELAKSSIKLAVVIAIAYNFISDRIGVVLTTPSMDLLQSSTYVLESIIGLVFNIGLIFIFIAALDYLYQKWDFERGMKMTKQEVKEEYKQMEGDPKIKSKIRQTQREMAMSRMMQAVPTADVIIRNPTHFAVALRYDIDKDNAPIVVAKGQDEVALRIIRIGEEHGVYITEDKPLARALYAGVELNREIPYEFYAAIAEVLAVLYRMKAN